MADPACETSQRYMTLGAAVVTEVAKLAARERPALRWGLFPRIDLGGSIAVSQM